MGREPTGPLSFAGGLLSSVPRERRARLDRPAEAVHTRAMSEWVRTLLVGAGGFVGATLRYTVGGLVSRAVPPDFPWATLAVNVSGCFVIGLLAVLAEERGPLGPAGRLFLMVGILGGYTTFSTFGYETLSLVREGSHGLAAANAVGQVLVGLGAVWAGMTVARVVA